MLRTLESLGATIVDSKIFPDHHPYTSTDVEQIIDWADANRNDFDFLITSEKDLVKLQTASLANYALYALSIQMNIRKGEEELRQIINEKVRGKHISARFTEGEQYV
jgi:tetraacyldisaccharide 4'-kinase